MSKQDPEPPPLDLELLESAYIRLVEQPEPPAQDPPGRFFVEWEVPSIAS